MYDGWLSTISSYNAFRRIVLLLRGLAVNAKRTKTILQPAGSSSSSGGGGGGGGTGSSGDTIASVGGTGIWPTLSIEEWTTVEGALLDLISSDHANIKGVDATSLAQSDLPQLSLLSVDTQANGPGLQSSPMFREGHSLSGGEMVVDVCEGEIVKVEDVQQRCGHH
jgi:pre-mRNA-processing factor 8